MDSENIFLVISLFLAMTMCISWLVFGRLTMARIEREIKADNLPRPCSWDGPGARTLWYAYAIALPIGVGSARKDPTIDAPLVRRYSTPRDVLRGWTLVVSGNLFLVAVLLGWALGYY